MGSSSSSIKTPEIATEIERWVDHKLHKDCVEAALHYINIDKMSNNIYTYFEERKSCGFKYYHWLLSDDIINIEFTGNNIFEAKIETNSRNIKNAFRVTKYEFNEVRRKRAKDIIGTRNQSLVLRNCEHALNYIISGTWYSLQSLEAHDGIIFNTFAQQTGFPSKLLSIHPEELITPFRIKNQPFKQFLTSETFKYETFTYKSKSRQTIDRFEDTINILVIGPTGEGKSLLINYLFNQEVCYSDSTAYSVTKSIEFIRGKGLINNQKKDIIIADTIGLCDTVLKTADVISIIKSAVKERMVKLHYIIFMLPRRFYGDADASFKNLLKWLKYFDGRYCDRFLFLINRSGNNTDYENDNLLTTIASSYSLMHFIGGERVLHCIDLRKDETSIKNGTEICYRFFNNTKINNKYPITFNSFNNTSGGSCVLL